MKKITLLLCTLLSLFTAAFANNVQVTGVSYNAGSHQVLFTLTWENSWDLAGAPGNHDAVWIFIKCQTGNNVWSHAQLSTTASAHTLGSSLALAQPGAMNPYGVLIKRGTPGFGNINGGNTVSLQLTTPTGITAIQLFAVEMVYVTGGPFGIGHSSVAGTLAATTISNENMIPAGSLRMNASDIPAAFPKGFNAFYVMKYEISQGQYTDFLNTLTRTQQIARVATDISGTAVTNRYVMSNQAGLTQYNHIMCPATLSATESVIFSCAVPEKACNYLGWADYASYLDWAGLRPFTEMEFEKICRGFDARIDEQLIWGGIYINTNQLPTSTGIIDADLPTETTIWSDAATNPNGYANVSKNHITGGRLMRCGFPGDKPTNRILSGATYFGAMEMAGNAGEYVVQVEDGGLLFTGENGNGDVSDVPANWPDFTTASGINSKGGHFRSSIQAGGSVFMIQTRDGFPASGYGNNQRYDYQGGRGALSL